MNIVFLYRFPIKPYSGGIERVSYLLAEQFSSIGNNVMFLCTTPNQSINFENSSFPQIYLSDKKKNQNNEFKDIIENFKTDIIINQSVNHDSYKLLNYLKKQSSSAKTNPKVITVLHNKPFHFDRLGRIYKLLSYPDTLKGKLLKAFGILLPALYINARTKDLLKTLEKIISVSDKFYLLSDLYKPGLYKHLPTVDKEKIDAINNPNTFDSPNIPLPEKENIVLFVGRLEDPQKNVKGFIDVWKKFQKHHKDWKAIIAGDGPHKDIFRKYAVKKKIKNLEFAGNITNISDLYARSKFLCMTSLYEGWPMVLTEAMAYGCIPFVYDTFEAIHEQISHGTSGFICQPYNSNLMSKEMSELAKDDKLRNMIMTNAREQIKKYDISIISKIWTEKLRELLNS